jgi:hypothetical protein
MEVYIMPPLSIFNDQAFLVSPLEIPLYLLELSANAGGPDAKDALLEGEIRSRLKTLYPGAPDNTVIDYALCRRKKKDAPALATVYVSSRATCEIYRGLKRPLVPGTALMRIALRGAGLGTALCVISTPEWIEAAFFEDGLVLRYGSCPAPSLEPPFSFIASFVNSGKAGPAAALLIHAGERSGQNEKTEKMLLQFFPSVTTLDITEIAIKGKLKNLGIFNDSRRRSLGRQKRSAGALLILCFISLLLSLRGVSERTKQELSRIETQAREQQRVLDRAKALENEIAELLTNNGTNNRAERADPYGIIAGLQSCLSGGWIQSLVIQGDNFDLEAEGADAIGVLQSLQTSGRFSELSLRRAASSPLAGDQFAISGRAGSHEKN